MRADSHLPWCVVLYDILKSISNKETYRFLTEIYLFSLLFWNIHVSVRNGEAGKPSFE